MTRIIRSGVSDSRLRVHRELVGVDEDADIDDAEAITDLDSDRIGGDVPGEVMAVDDEPSFGRPVGGLDDDAFG